MRISSPAPTQVHPPSLTSTLGGPRGILLLSSGTFQAPDAGASRLPPSLLNEATGSLLDDVQLVNTLQTSKITATEVTEQLETSETTEINIDLAREVNFCTLRSRP